MSAIALVRATFADGAEAERIGRIVVDEGLAACVNIETVRSLFRWQGETCAANEAAALFKTRPALAARLAERIAALHSYDLAAIEWWPATVSDAVAEWVGAATHD
jgi:periplasmic divalent cation tolerance protein